jgi:hypothetical protein
MIPAERQNLILEWLAANGSLTIDALSERLEVSPMTVHRDLDALARDGRVVKVHGGVALAQPAPENRASLCRMCDRPVQQRTAFTIRLENGSVQTACCPHCGLLLLDDQKVASVLATDFLYGRVVNAAQAVYLLESQVAICCVPSVLAFADADDARRFQKGFGGKPMTFTEARHHLHEHHGNIHVGHSMH